MPSPKKKPYLLLLPASLLLAALVTGCLSDVTSSEVTPAGSPSPESACSCPALVFSDPEFAFELIRTLSAVYAGEADVDECLATASRIDEGDFESWYSEWNRTADHFRQEGDESLAAGHTVSAREAYYRAATYYRTAEFFLHGNPADPRIVATWRKSRDAFRAALALDTVPYEIVAIPYGNTTLPGYFYSADSSGKARPLLIVQTGFDGCQEELHPYAMEGIERGYNVLTFEGPGQGGVIRMQHIPFRADWENVITPVVDYAVSRPDVDKDRIALWGISLGGYLAPRGAASEHRIAALVADGGVYDVGGALLRGMQKEGAFANLTREDLKAYLLTDPAEFNDGVRAAMEKSTSTRWQNEQGMFAFNKSSPALFWADYMDFSLEGRAENIRCPTLVTAGTDDQFDPGADQAQALYDHLACGKDLVIYSGEFGAQNHCQMGAFAQSFTGKFDWLDEQLDPGR